MRAIPKKLRKQLEDDEFMQECCIPQCHRAPEWNHVWTFAGKQINEAWAIVPVCKQHHDEATPHKPSYSEERREYLEWVSLNRASLQDVLKYSKQGDATWLRQANYLNVQAKKYGWT